MESHTHERTTRTYGLCHSCVCERQLTPNRESFISVLRIVRRWAKRRGLYSNKMGYLGGVNWCILVCFINQLYPTAAPSTLLLRFFMVLANWKWPLAIQVQST